MHFLMLSKPFIRCCKPTIYLYQFLLRVNSLNSTMCLNYKQPNSQPKTNEYYSDTKYLHTVSYQAENQDDIWASLFYYTPY
jgi:hypothetical protein